MDLIEEKDQYQDFKDECAHFPEIEFMMMQQDINKQ